VLSEVQIIERARSRFQLHGHGVDALGLHDDAALLSPQPGQQLCLSVDTLNVGVHFLEDDPPFDLGYKALAVNLSDLAAMGARPLAFSLALSAPSVNAQWLDALLDGMQSLASEYALVLLGGDTTRGGLSLNLTVIGSVPEHAALRRDRARVGELLYVSGTLGLAGMALEAKLGAKLPWDEELARLCMQRLHRPEPRLALAQALREMGIRCAMDLSDGLAQDLPRLCHASACGAIIECEALPLAPGAAAMLGLDAAVLAALAGGEDYELLFSADPAMSEALAELAVRSQIALTPIGRVIAGSGVQVLDAEQRPIDLSKLGFRHFA
jgi:thiamine-monophosphate kinase